MKNKVWFISGCSTGLGRALAVEVISKGYQVVVASRKTEDIEDIILNNPNAIGVVLDMTKPDQIKAAVEKAHNVFGKIDVLVNNAGIGYFAALEESDETEIRKMFEVNFFGLATLTQMVLPHMRKQKRGHIINVSSLGGLVGFPALSFYNATKFAVAGLSESLAKETAPLGIKVSIVCPSGFRTDWAGRSAEEGKDVIADYQLTAGLNKSNIRDVSGKQAGDPTRAAKAIVAITEVTEPPLYLLLGEASLRNFDKKMVALNSDIGAWKETTIGADFPKKALG